MTNENNSIRLQPSSRPDRKFLWVRYQHPVTKQKLRVDLGSDPEEAKLICDDLSYILNTEQSWDNRNSSDLDGLHPKALDSFFEPMWKTMREMKETGNETRFELLSTGQTHLGLKLDLNLMFIAKVLARNANAPVDREILKYLGFLKPESPEDLVDQAEIKTGFRFACPDGTVVYGGSDIYKAIDTHLSKKFGKNSSLSTHIWLTSPDQKYVPELRALYCTSTGAFEVPEKLSGPPKLFRCVYRIACPDGVVHFADGGIAYDRLYRTLKQKYKIRKCEITVEQLDRLRDPWISELKCLYPAPDGGYKIPFPDAPPKRSRRK